MSKHGHDRESVNRPGICLTPHCKQPRDSGTWYCKDCNDDFRAQQDARRGTVGSYPDRKPEPKAQPKMSLWDGSSEVPIGGSKAISDSHTYSNGKGVEWKGQVSNGGQGSFSSRPACDNGGQGHDGQHPFYTFPDGRMLYGARGSNLTHGNLDHLNLIIDCAGVVAESGRFVKSAPAKYRGLKGFEVDVMRLDWPDMTAPVNVGIRWWLRLFELLPKRTCICCVGGHGRTGTALACLLVASGMDAEDAIRTVREKHCKRAIETVGQESYIKGLAKAKAALEQAVLKAEPEAKVANGNEGR